MTMFLVEIAAWVSPATSQRSTIPFAFRRIMALQSDRFKKDLEDRSRQRAQGEGTGEMAAGAILGGLVLGPFGRCYLLN
jgi:hypothetical protein